MSLIIGVIAPEGQYKEVVRARIADLHNFILDFRRAQQSGKPRFEIFLEPGATPRDLNGSEPHAWRAIQGHSGEKMFRTRKQWAGAC